MNLSILFPSGFFHFLLKRPVSCQKSQDPGKGGHSSDPHFAHEENRVLWKIGEKEDFGRVSCLEKEGVAVPHARSVWGFFFAFLCFPSR